MTETGVYEECPRCQGTGLKESYRQLSLDGFAREDQPCPFCLGTGIVPHICVPDTNPYAIDPWDLDLP